MKLQNHFNTPSGRSRSRHRSNGGFAVVIMLMLVSIALIYTGANARSLNRLSRQLKALEQKQIHRLNSAITNNSTARIVGTNATVTPLPAMGSASE